MKNIYHEYSCILIKTEEMNEKMRKNKKSSGALPKLLISQLLNALLRQSDFKLMLRHRLFTKMISFITHQI